VPEEDIDLLPRFMPGFDLERKVIIQMHIFRVPLMVLARCKAWVLFDVDEVMPIKFNDNAWKHIVLEENSKVSPVI